MKEREEVGEGDEKGERWKGKGWKGRREGRRDKRAPQQARALTCKRGQRERRKRREGRGEGRDEDMRAVGLLHIRFAFTRDEQSCHSAASAHL